MADTWFLWWVLISLTLWWLRRPIVYGIAFFMFLAIVNRIPSRRVRRGVVSH